ncbi:MAG: hypothetical protein AAFZ87_04815 [Planctomycetota bacterium]
MPSAIKTAAEYGDDLTVLFVEVQGASPEKAEQFAWKRKWMGANAIWTTETPFRIPQQGIPKCALVSSSGEVLLTGRPHELHKQIEEAIDADIAARKDGPSDAPKSLKKHYKALAKGQVGKALAGANGIVAAAGDDVAAATELVESITARVERSMARFDTMLAEGMVIEAEEHFDALEKSLKGTDTFAEALAAKEAALEAADKGAAKKLTKIVRALEEDGPSDANVAKLAKFAKKNADGPVGKRARRLLDVLGG